MVLGKGRPQFYKVVSLVGTLAAWVLSTVPLFKFDSKAAGFQFVEDFVWVRRFHIHYGFGVDGIAALLLFLTTLLGVVVIIASWNYIKDRERGFFVTLLLLQTGMSGVFLSTDIFLFYVFWEVMLVPMYFIIGIWGGPRRITPPSSSSSSRWSAACSCWWPSSSWSITCATTRACSRSTSRS